MQRLYSDWLSHWTLSAISVQWLELVYEVAKLYCFAKVFEENFDERWTIKILRRLNEGPLWFLDLKNVGVIEKMMHMHIQLQF